MNYKHSSNSSSTKEELRQLVLQGAIERYGNEFVQTPVFIQRFEIELQTLCANEAVVNYLLMIMDTVNAAREMGVCVGPGRGSAAGSLVLYCLHITDIDPLKYGLLFERFFNPERDKLPKIDIDIEEGGYHKVLDYLTAKYGQSHVAQVATYSKQKNSDIQKTSVCPYAIVLCRENISDLVPMIWVEDSNHQKVLVTSYDCSTIESVGLIKIDIIELKSLNVFSKFLNEVKTESDFNRSLADIPFDIEDPDTLSLFQKGDTDDIFQFGSKGMKTYLRELKPESFSELVALNTMYRPGLMELIPSLIRRKRREESIIYELPIMEKYLKETFGVTIYQEQVMLLAQEIAGFTPNESDNLRRALGRKKVSELTDLHDRFIEGGQKNSYNRDVLERIWMEWEKNACYYFNKSHSVCYTLLSYLNAYIKSNHNKPISTKLDIPAAY